VLCVSGSSCQQHGHAIFGQCQQARHSNLPRRACVLVRKGHRAGIAHHGILQNGDGFRRYGLDLCPSLDYFPDHSTVDLFLQQPQYYVMQSAFAVVGFRYWYRQSFKPFCATLWLLADIVRQADETARIMPKGSVRSAQCQLAHTKLSMCTPDLLCDAE
jgi:hypothetical protein